MLYCMKKVVILVLGLITAAWVQAQAVLLDTPPRHYICQTVTSPLKIDGKDDEPDWQAMPWSELFMDIEGPDAPKQFLNTQVKMLWDKEYLYILARLQEPNLWATFTERESIIFHENNFEVFIDPDWDTHNYYELEINALGTTWDLMLTRPYSLMGRAVSAWDITGLKKGIHLKGTINNPNDMDTCWMVELAIPFKILAECAPDRSAPGPGDIWRINFSRVEWDLEAKNHQYSKKTDPLTGKPLPEHNWVWSPQYQINMHKPEYWGMVLFSNNKAGTKETFVSYPDAEIYYALRQLFDEQYQYFEKNEKFAEQPEQLPSSKFLGSKYQINLQATTTSFRLWAPATSTGEWLILTEDGRIRRSRTPLHPVF